MDLQVIKRGAAILTILVGAVGCGAPVVNEYPYRESDDTSPTYAEGLGDYNSKRGSVFGEGGLAIGGTDRPELGGGGGGGLGVNSYLWRASLDTISFMPVNSADPFGGVIITDWHSPGQVDSETVQDERLHPGPRASRRRGAGRGLPTSAGQGRPVGVTPTSRSRRRPPSRTPSSPAPGNCATRPSASNPT